METSEHFVGLLAEFYIVGCKLLWQDEKSCFPKALVYFCSVFKVAPSCSALLYLPYEFHGNLMICPNEMQKELDDTIVLLRQVDLSFP